MHSAIGFRPLLLAAGAALLLGFIGTGYATAATTDLQTSGHDEESFVRTYRPDSVGYAQALRLVQSLGDLRPETRQTFDGPGVITLEFSRPTATTVIPRAQSADPEGGGGSVPPLDPQPEEPPQGLPTHGPGGPADPLQPGDRYTVGSCFSHTQTEWEYVFVCDANDCHWAATQVSRQSVASCR